MDPEACVMAFQTAAADGEHDLMADCVEAYDDWKATGGYSAGCLHDGLSWIVDGLLPDGQISIHRIDDSTGVLVLDSRWVLAAEVML